MRKLTAALVVAIGSLTIGCGGGGPSEGDSCVARVGGSVGDRLVDAEPPKEVAGTWIDDRCVPNSRPDS